MRTVARALLAMFLTAFVVFMVSGSSSWLFVGVICVLFAGWFGCAVEADHRERQAELERCRQARRGGNRVSWSEPRR